ncbi:hypothetical protein CUY_4827 [Bacteroides ovatus SD CMC 3f]|nr:hypothetical protein CUY_4827 [Bacteroides ovatus SD CMC 3f]
MLLKILLFIVVLFLLCKSVHAVMRKTFCRQKRNYRLMPKPLSGI